MTISGDAIRDELGHYLSRLWRYALVLSHRRDIADDLVQATCVRALERAAQFTPGWLLYTSDAADELDGVDL
ncbi:hypothetical protein GP913_27280, partial [Enterobacteriaceae bacterium 8376wG6]|nr:hypothetical protein [Enterobacteriaceae bacterium 8376wG6]